MTWRDRAACRDASPQEFDSTTWADHLRARMLCADCPVTIQCRAESRGAARIPRPQPQRHLGGRVVARRQAGPHRAYNQHRYRGVPIPLHDPCGCRAAGTRRRAEQARNTRR